MSKETKPEMAVEEFAEKWGRGKWEDNTIDLLADFHAAVESLMPNRVEILSEGTKRFTTNTGVLQSDKYKGFVSGARFVLSRILEAIEQNVREK